MKFEQNATTTLKFSPWKETFKNLGRATRDMSVAAGTCVAIGNDQSGVIALKTTDWVADVCEDVRNNTREFRAKQNEAALQYILSRHAAAVTVIEKESVVPAVPVAAAAAPVAVVEPESNIIGVPTHGKGARTVVA